MDSSILRDSNKSKKITNKEYEKKWVKLKSMVFTINSCLTKVQVNKNTDSPIRTHH